MLCAVELGIIAVGKLAKDIRSNSHFSEIAAHKEKHNINGQNICYKMPYLLAIVFHVS